MLFRVATAVTALTLYDIGATVVTPRNRVIVRHRRDSAAMFCRLRVCSNRCQAIP